jgi:uncharacterized protein (TIGR02118 family)
MIRVSVLYPNKPGSRFDVEYYLNFHVPLSARLLEPVTKGMSVEIGVGGIEGTSQPFAAIWAITCESVEAFTAAFREHSAELQADMPKYTDIEPIFQVSEIRIEQSAAEADAALTS